MVDEIEEADLSRGFSDFLSYRFTIFNIVAPYPCCINNGNLFQSCGNIRIEGVNCSIHQSDSSWRTAQCAFCGGSYSCCGHNDRFRWYAYLCDCRFGNELLFFTYKMFEDKIVMLWIADAPKYLARKRQENG